MVEVTSSSIVLLYPNCLYFRSLSIGDIRRHSFSASVYHLLIIFIQLNNCIISILSSCRECNYNPHTIPIYDWIFPLFRENFKILTDWAHYYQVDEYYQICTSSSKTRCLNFITNVVIIIAYFSFILLIALHRCYIQAIILI